MVVRDDGVARVEYFHSLLAHDGDLALRDDCEIRVLTQDERVAPTRFEQRSPDAVSLERLCAAELIPKQRRYDVEVRRSMPMHARRQRRGVKNQRPASLIFAR